MSYINAHLKEFEEKLGFPAEAVETFENTLKLIESNEAFYKKFEAIKNEYMYPETDGVHKALSALKDFSEEIGVHEYTVDFVFFMVCSEILLERYKEKGISVDIYWESMMDMRYKFNECLDCKGIYGTFVASWFDGFFSMNRFGLGRFQYEYSEFDRDDYTTESGIVIKEDESAIGFHIPWSGVSMTDDQRIASYKRAYEFFKDKVRDDGLLLLKCGSWLLYEGHREFLPETSNVLRFMDDFIILESEEKPEFNDAWRLYGGAGYKAPEEWPETNSLYRAFKKRVLSGGKTGSGFGIVLFDGEKVVK